jgi:hypothetical protein
MYYYNLQIKFFKIIRKIIENISLFVKIVLKIIYYTYECKGNKIFQHKNFYYI